MKQPHQAASLIQGFVVCYIALNAANSTNAELSTVPTINFNASLMHLDGSNGTLAQNSERSSIRGSQELVKVVENSGTTVILPPFYDEQKVYPAVVLLPFTGGTGLRFFEWAFENPYRNREANPFIVIIPSGTGSMSDYNTGDAFNATIERYENQVISDLETLIPKYKIDETRVSIGGYSLGADLAWALSLRNPGLFSGAVLIDSFCSYRRSDSMNQLAARSFRIFMIVGQKEAGEENHPMNDIRILLNKYGIYNLYKEFPQSDHNTILNEIPPEIFMQAVDYSLAI